MDTLDTGDLLLFNNHSHGIFGLFTSLIKFGTQSKYSHIGMILKNPTFIHPSLKGTFVWESSYNGLPDPQDGKIKLGVQITPLHELIEEYKKTNGHIYVRKLKIKSESRLECFNELLVTLLRKEIFNDKIMNKIHNTVYDKPYDIVPKDWIEALFRKDDKPQKTDRFWCSALVGYIYTQVGILEKSTDWSVMRPSDFSVELEKLNYTGKCFFEKKEIILF